MEWLKLLIESLLGLGVLGIAFKWVFSPRFRISLRKKNFQEDKNELDTYLEAHKRFRENLITPIQFQYVTNSFLGTTKFHYSLLSDRIERLWNFNKVLSDLNYSYFFVKQVIRDDQASLEYIFKRKTLKKIMFGAISIFFLAVLFYIGLVIFEIFFLNELLSQNKIDKETYIIYKGYSIVLYVILIFGASFFGGKASTAIALKDTFDIQEKNEQR